ncbi:MAG TPA: CPBP family intramembrane metalloprotease [Candidatus Omnitrophica bacterium]|nr:CPBP family intramembrane metalloprotease [Candidatus Omnitrophota bacterium]
MVEIPSGFKSPPRHITTYFMKKKNIPLSTLFLIVLLTLVINISSFDFLNKSVKKSTLSPKDTSLEINTLIKNSSKLIEILSICLFLGLIFGLFLEIKFLLKFLKEKKIGFLPLVSSSLKFKSFLDTVVLIIFFYSVFKFIELTFLNGNQKILVLFLNGIFQIFSLLTILSFFKREELEIRLERVDKLFFTAFKTYVGILPLLLFSIFISFLIFKILNIKPEPMPVVVFTLKEKNSLFLFILALEAIFLAPIVEELFFRGLLFKLLRKKFSFILSSLLTGCIFSLLHNNSFSFLPVLTLSVGLAYIYERKKNLLAPVFLHSFHNFISFFLLILLR